MTVLRSRRSTPEDTIDPLSDPLSDAVSAPLSDLPSGRADPGVLGIGAYAPATVLDNAELSRMVDTSDLWILERTGIRERRRGGPEDTTSRMGAAAAQAALERAGNPAIDVIIVATVSPDTLFPSTACLIQRHLGMPGIPAFDVSGACSGFMYGLVLADSLIRTGQARHALVVASESMTSLVDYGDRSTCVLFGDGAGAAVVGVGDRGGLRATRWGADGREVDLIHYGPDPDLGGAPHIQMRGKGTFRIAVERMVETAQGLCEDAGWRIEDVDHVVPHQANLRIIDAVAKRLAVPADKLVINGDLYGNTSAASIPLALAEADAAGRLHPGDRILCVAFGAGTTWGGIALEWAMEPPRQA